MIQFVKESSLREDGGGREGDTQAFPWKDACPSRKLHYPKKYNDSRCKSPKWVLMFNFQVTVIYLYYIILLHTLVWQTLRLSNCVKSDQIKSYFWSLFSCIRTEYRDLRSASYFMAWLVILIFTCVGLMEGFAGLLHSYW